MAQIAICTSKLKGLLYASFELASRLESEGHSVTFLCPIDVKDLIEEEGFKFNEVPNIKFWYKPNAIKSNTWIERFKTHFSSKELDYDTLKNELHIPIYINTLQKLKPDLVLCDMQLHEIIFVTIGLKLPIQLLSPWFCMRRISGLPPIRSNIAPSHNSIRTYFEIEKFWFKLKAKIYIRYFSDILTFRNYRRHVLKKYAKEVGFSTKKLILRNFPSHFIYNSLPILTLTMKEMEFPHKSPSNLKYLGLMVYENRIDKGYPQVDKVRLSKLFDAKTKEGKKLIYCGMGSMEKGDIPFLNKLFESVKDKSEWILIVSLGNLLCDNDFSYIPRNVHLFNWVSQPQLIKQMDCCVNHAGINTINECIHFKVPMLVYSGKKFDQNGCAARVHYHKLGLMGDKDHDSSVQIEEKINTIFNDKSFQNNINAFNDFYRKYQKNSLTELLKI